MSNMRDWSYALQENEIYDPDDDTLDDEPVDMNGPGQDAPLDSSDGLGDGAGGDDYVKLLERTVRLYAKTMADMAREQKKCEALQARVTRARPRGQAGQGSVAFEKSLRQETLGERRALMREAERGFDDLEIHRNGNGTSKARIDGRMVKLSKTRTALIELLWAPGSAREGELVDWKSIDSLRASLEQSQGRHFTLDTFRNLVSMTRTALLNAGINPYFIQSRDGEAYRLAWRYKEQGGA